MNQFSQESVPLDDLGPARLHYLYDPATGLRAVVVIDTVRFPVAGGGVRMAADVTLGEIVRLARAMSYKYALLDMPCGGAKAGVWLDPDDASRARVVTAFLDAIRPMVERLEFVPGADMGTSSADFEALFGGARASDGFAQQLYDGLPLEAQLTGAGVVSAARAACDTIGRPLSRATVALEGFGKVGAGAARFFAREGARVVAISTRLGARYEPAGFDVEAMLTLRAQHGDAAIERTTQGRAIAREALFTLPVDVLMPGARPDVLNGGNVDAVQAWLVAPAANIPYASGVTARLSARGTVALPDFVTNAGGVLAAMVGMQGGTADAAFTLVRTRIAENTRRVLEVARTARIGAYEAGVKLARNALGVAA